MELAAFVTFLWSVIVLTQAEGSHDSGLSERFIIQDIVPYQMIQEECTLCKCFNECHGGAFHVSQDTLCKDHYAKINCLEVDRCTCCDNLSLWKPCQNGGRCHNLGQGDFNCDCLPQYYGPKCEHKGVDECASHPCMHGSTCTNTGTSYTCTCPSGYTGDRCQYDECHGSKCGKHGVCQHHASFPFYHCNCSQGYFGHNCEYNFCDVKHCNNGGSCLPLDNHPFFRCICVSGYTGDTCDISLMKPAWTQWFYGACSVTCGNGTVVRIRKCSTGHDEDCEGSSMETTTCTEKSC